MDLDDMILFLLFKLNNQYNKHKIAKKSFLNLIIYIWI